MCGQRSSVVLSQQLPSLPLLGGLLNQHPLDRHSQAHSFLAHHWSGAYKWTNRKRWTLRWEEPDLWTHLLITRLPSVEIPPVEPSSSQAASDAAPTLPPEDLEESEEDLPDCLVTPFSSAILPSPLMMDAHLTPLATAPQTW